MYVIRALFAIQATKKQKQILLGSPYAFLALA